MLDQVKSEWTDLQTILEVTRERELKGKKSVEVEYYISSLPLNAKEASDAIRNHWQVESAHWILDMTYREDESRIRRENAAENMALLRRFALNLAKLHPQKNSMRGKLKMAMWSDEFRAELLLGQLENKV